MVHVPMAANFSLISSASQSRENTVVDGAELEHGFAQLLRSTAVNGAHVDIEADHSDSSMRSCSADESSRSTPGWRPLPRNVVSETGLVCRCRTLAKDSRKASAITSLRLRWVRASTPGQLSLTTATLLMTTVLLGGLLVRQRRGWWRLGFDGILLTAIYAATVITLAY